MNAYYEFIIHIMSSLWIHYNEIKFMNSDWIPWTLISEFLVHIFMNPYINWESIHLNSYTWIHMNSFIHFIYEFRCIWIHIIISYMNSHNDYMNSYVYKFIYMTSYMNSYTLWIHMIFSYMNSYVSCIHRWIWVYQGSRWSRVECSKSSFFLLGLQISESIRCVHAVYMHSECSWHPVPVAFQTDRNQTNDQTVSGHEPNH